MIKHILTVGLLAYSCLAGPQFQGDSSLAKILQEQRFNSGDGKFGSAFAQEDGHVFKEESQGNNNRIGQYSYIGDDGKTYTVKYSAGVDGFRILEGDHIPSGGQTSAAAVMGENGELKEYDYEYYDEAKPDSPFVNPHDPTHRQEFLLAGDLAGHLAQRTFTTPAPLVLGGTTEEPVHRFFPPGQIKLDRFPEGFNFQFQSQK
ncbi:uncharacterized protein LOC111703388 [Eurytemora carolleeae]|uniref:uncharacterized protein LOC111703388 n=1 Tax=Eurytemora carolleeae TaxID=1294199 RepID=UPI000C77C6B7|nr:uncharacterized protein LOC111703388 [Eurytemora carolleeae]|eukprot:XP_023331084.1 uncharacterized protein LOC111703388 [Eurytemora affinis]